METRRRTDRGAGPAVPVRRPSVMTRKVSEVQVVVSGPALLGTSW